MIRCGFYILVMFFSYFDLAHAQLQQPQVSDTFYMYKTVVDFNQTLEQQVNFYEIDFPCLSTMAVTDSRMPRTDYEFMNLDGKGITLGYSDNILSIKGIRKGITYLDKPTDYVQFRNGIPLVNLKDPSKTRHEGEEDIYLEYDVLDVNEPLMIWCQIFDYERLRLKLRIKYNSQYLDYSKLRRFDDQYFHSIQTRYIEYVEEIEGKKDGEWVPIKIDEIPSEIIQFEESRTDFISYYTNDVSIPAIIKYDSPETVIEFYMRVKGSSLPECNTKSQHVYVYPNPTYNELNIKMIGHATGEYIVSIFNIVGKELWTKKFVNGEEDVFSWLLPYMPKGIYLYNIKDIQGRYVEARRLTILEH